MTCYRLELKDASNWLICLARWVPEVILRAESSQGWGSQGWQCAVLQGLEHQTSRKASRQPPTFREADFPVGCGSRETWDKSTAWQELPAYRSCFGDEGLNQGKPCNAHLIQDDETQAGHTTAGHDLTGQLV
jgi:hypothetical protein